MPRQRRPIMPLAMPVKLVAESLGIDRNVVYAAVRNKELTVYCKGVRRLILTIDVIDWIRTWKTE